MFVGLVLRFEHSELRGSLNRVRVGRSLRVYNAVFRRHAHRALGDNPRQSLNHELPHVIRDWPPLTPRTAQELHVTP